MDATLLTALVALLVAIGGIITAIATRKKASAEAAELISETVLKLLKPLRQRIEELEGEVRQYKQEVEDVRWWAERLVEQVERLGGEPVKFVRRKK